MNPTEPKPQTPLTDAELKHHIANYDKPAYAEAVDLARSLELKLQEGENNLRLIGDMAVVDWDDTTVGKVDALIKGNPPQTYIDKVRNLYKRAQEAEQLEIKLAEAEAKLEVESANEKCIICNKLWSPSLVESSHCIFCIANGYKSQVTLMTGEIELAYSRLKEAERQRDDYKSAHDALAELNKDLCEERDLTAQTQRAEAAERLVARLRADLLNPPADLQELVIKNLNLVAGEALDNANATIAGLKAELHDARQSAFKEAAEVKGIKI